MENEIKSTDELENTEPVKNEPPKDRLLPVSIVLAALIIAGAWIYTNKNSPGLASLKSSGAAVSKEDKKSLAKLEDTVLPTGGVILPVKWGDLGLKLVSTGVIDPEKFKEIYKDRNNLSGEIQKTLEETNEEYIKVNDFNSGLWLNLFWALGLGNKNPVLDKGPMMTYSGAGLPAEALAKVGNFASTGGWTVARDNAMDHYSRHPFIVLTKEQQELVERVAKSIYRPCCNNSTYFPDCNHGMAMLGLLELMASQGVSEGEMYKIALKVNSYWFPDTYLAIAKYFQNRGVAWKDVKPQEILGQNYSSATGYQKILAAVEPPSNRGGGGCGVQ